MTTRLGIAAWAALLALALGAGCRRPAEPASAAPARARADGGGWEEIRIGTDAGFSGIHFVDAEAGWIVGGSPFVSGGIAGRTEDGGRTWRFVTGVTKGGPTSVLGAVHGFDRMRACVVGDGAFLTFDGGQSWQRARAVRKAAAHLSALDFLNENEGWAAGVGGVLHTTDGGMNWMEIDSNPARVDSPSNAPHVAARVLKFTDTRNGWLAGHGGAVYRTRDGGVTWAPVAVPRPPGAARPPYWFGGTWSDAAHGWLVGEFGAVVRTEDGGETWTLVDAGAGAVFFTAIAFAGADGWIVGFVPDGARSVVVRTRDGGATWAPERTLDGEELRALQVLDADTAWAVGDRVRTEPQRMLRRAGRSRP